MTTIFKTATTTPEQSRGMRVWRLAAAVSAAVFILGLVGSNIARGQVSPLQIIALAQGSTPSKTPTMKVNGPNDVLQAKLVFQPGAETGWHIHPGPVVVVVSTGAITETHANGCITVHPAGSVFFETANEVHNATNHTGIEADVFATFISPAGSKPLIPVDNPGRVCRPGDDQGDDK
jgi:quercetin dioxygenase-like cupin family protein